MNGISQAYAASAAASNAAAKKAGLYSATWHSAKRQRSGRAAGLASASAKPVGEIGPAARRILGLMGDGWMRIAEIYEAHQSDHASLALASIQSQCRRMEDERLIEGRIVDVPGRVGRVKQYRKLVRG